MLTALILISLSQASHYPLSRERITRNRAMLSGSTSAAACVPVVCADVGLQCGAAVSDGCGGTLSCGCDAGSSCDWGQCATPFLLSVAPTTATPCECADATLATGETVADVRDSGAMCTKHDWLANIATGDLVWCAGNQLRVMPGGDGDGGLGYLSEGPGRNWNTEQDI